MVDRPRVDVSQEMFDRASEAVEQGSYESAGAVVDDALRLWALERDRQIARFREEVARGFASPMRKFMGVEAEMKAWRDRQAASPK